MEIALGFIIAIFIALTGVGAGSMTTPLLILLIGMPTRQAVGTALIFGAVVKILTTPMYIKRRQVDWRAFGFLMATGLPGVLIGTLLLQGFKSDLLTAFVGFTIVSIATHQPFPVFQHHPAMTGLPGWPRSAYRSASRSAFPRREPARSARSA